MLDLKRGDAYMKVIGDLRRSAEVGKNGFGCRFC